MPPPSTELHPEPSTPATRLPPGRMLGQEHQGGPHRGQSRQPTLELSERSALPPQRVDHCVNRQGGRDDRRSRHHLQRKGSTPHSLQGPHPSPSCATHTCWQAEQEEKDGSSTRAWDKKKQSGENQYTERSASRWSPSSARPQKAPDREPPPYFSHSDTSMT